MNIVIRLIKVHKMKEKPEKQNKFKNFFDMIMFSIADYFNRKYRIQKRVEEIKNEAIGSLYKLKRSFVTTLVESLFLVTGLFALIIGLILLLSKHLPLEYILLGYGIIVTIIILLRMKLSA